MPVTVIEGEQRGDEGKGRFVDMFMSEFDIGARFNGGDNAGHTVVAPDGKVYKLHGLPSSIVRERAMSVIGNGTVINPVRLSSEMDTLMGQGIDIGIRNLLISGGAHLTMPHHILEDEYREQGAAAQGSTKSGIAQAYSAKAGRVGVRAECINNDPERLFEMVVSGLTRLRQQKDIYNWTSEQLRQDRETAERYVVAAKRLGPFVTDTALYLNRQLQGGARVLAEGAQAFLLDIDHGMYPYVTSSSTTIGGVSTGLGVPPKYIERVIGVSKAIQSHVGGGPFVTEITEETLLARLHGDMDAVDAERGTTTGRIRRLGHLDLPQIRRSQMINGTTEAAITKLDWLERYGSDIPVCVAYERKGKPLDIAPDAAYKLEQSEPRYEFLPQCEGSIQDVRSFEDLPDCYRTYVEFVEKQTGTPITMIGVGPGRDQVIVR